MDLFSSYLLSFFFHDNYIKSISGLNESRTMFFKICQILTDGVIFLRGPEYLTFFDFRCFVTKKLKDYIWFFYKLLLTATNSTTAV